jgi:hypothetical protein
MDMRRLIATLALLLMIHARTAHADDKSPALALGLSVGSTVGGFLLVGSLDSDSEGAPRELMVPAALMMVTGPSWGHVYTGDYDLAIGGTLLRLVGGAMMAEGMGDCVVDGSDPYSIDPPCEYPNKTPGLVAAGAVLVFGTALAEMIDAPLAAKRYNREHAVTVTPMTGPGHGYGLSLSGRF